MVDELNQFREHTKKLIHFLLVNGFNYELPIFREEEEAATLATFLVLLSLVRFEYLVPIVLRIKALTDINFLHTIHLPYVMKHLWCIALHLNLDINLVEVVDPHAALSAS